MINNEKIGVGIVTCSRPLLLSKLMTSLKKYGEVIDHIVIVNDGDPISDSGLYPAFWIENETNIGVGKSKNKALKHLFNIGCDHIFMFEDDIFVKDSNVFERYITASKVSGIQHFNFSQHGVMNKTHPEKKPNPRIVVDYKDIKIAFYPHCVGAMSYYSKKCLEKVGLIDERYFNACEHVDHTLEIIKSDLHPDFWFFADIDESWKYLGDEEWCISKSTISSNPNHQQMMKDADEIFISKHGMIPRQIPVTGEESLFKNLKHIKQAYGR